MRKVLEKKSKMGEKWFAFPSPEALHTLADSNRGEQEKKKGAQDDDDGGKECAKAH